MKKRTIGLSLAVVLCLTLLALPALAAGPDFSNPPEAYDPEICREGSELWLEIYISTPTDVRNLMELLSYAEKEDYISTIQANVSVDGGPWQVIGMTPIREGEKWYGYWRTDNIPGLSADSWVQIQVRYAGVDQEGADVLSNWSEMLEINEENAKPAEEPPAEEPFEFNAHDWAKAELAEADGAGLIPESLRTADLTQPITRAEFAAVSVKVYEALSGLTAETAAENPFTDTSDPEVLKALNVGITNGLSETEFAPDKLLNREQAATMLSRVYKKVAFEGWTLGTDGDFGEAFRALFTMPEPFADDADISSWARDSVYFMASNGILKGMEGGTFQPRAVTEEQQAAGYAQATREQAILIAVRLVKNLGT